MIAWLIVVGVAAFGAFAAGAWLEARINGLERRIEQLERRA